MSGGPDPANSCTSLARESSAVSCWSLRSRSVARSAAVAFAPRSDVVIV